MPLREEWKPRLRRLVLNFGSPQPMRRRRVTSMQTCNFTVQATDNLGQQILGTGHYALFVWRSSVCQIE
jgi:hypothetical protein